jgi:hypothetical protein
MNRPNANQSRQILGVRRRSSSPPTPKRQRTRSAEPDVPHTNEPLSLNSIPAHTILQILEVRDRQAREVLLGDLRHLFAESSSATQSATTKSLPQSEDIDMDSPPTSTSEIAAALFAEMQKYGINGKLFI